MSKDKLEMQVCQSIAKNRYFKEGYNTAKQEILAELKLLETQPAGYFPDYAMIVKSSEIQKLIERLSDNE